MATVGELENYMPEEGGHGPQWADIVLDKHPDISQPEYESARNFVSSWAL